ncbi:MAG: phosphatidylglycerophosphatase A [Balneolaceae bacterium]
MRGLKLAIGTLFGAGLLPKLPGTWGTLASMLLIWPVAVCFGTWGLAIIVAVASLLTIWAADACENRWGRDPGQMVSDELAGQALVFFWIGLEGSLALDWPALLAGFLLFRIFDIFKPAGIGRLQHFPSGFGILLDDLLAGLYALGTLHILFQLL